MSYLYVCEQGASINYEQNRFHIKYKDDQIRSIPAETLEVIEIFGKIQFTTQCITECLKRGIDIIFFSVNKCDRIFLVLVHMWNLLCFFLSIRRKKEKVV